MGLANQVEQVLDLGCDLDKNKTKTKQKNITELNLRSQNSEVFH